jgi:flagellar assembly factor FliW
MGLFPTLRFGTIEIPEDRQIEFRRGLLGFEKLTRFAHIEVAEETPFGWLVSLEDPQVAFVVANPAVFFPHYTINIDVRELSEVRPGPNDRLQVLGVCTMPESFGEITMNLVGPLVINTATCKGKQIVLNRSTYSTRQRLTDSEITHEKQPDSVRREKPSPIRRRSASRTD